ncbi:E3 ubiquitin ligase complex subunit Mms1 [Schizosaccharomyces cryophilus OY26]|uniref:E3 ubiquitin ligase complex subunit Mms1 n=1 Tax=Schizosaccharomyces cryophilus (strain OY26 / ATCC MYA-4695 / CBS 11777 / NBRC 106824 / NRRL Y48691) TaxID=653667 RepID=S9XKD4_SCHCR|nr:E3 ubiquitin ligase complex subunit Mms1 [Schizosaccharomyces cryophilus OY26]EPY54171.1 E3 ubiquitin ligase complex subunit Mms1 [Schizosaccharomyces cryophilus OY26]
MDMIHPSHMFSWAFSIGTYEDMPLLLLGSPSSLLLAYFSARHGLHQIEFQSLPVRVRDMTWISSKHVATPKESLLGYLVTTTDVGVCCTFQIECRNSDRFSIQDCNEFCIDSTQSCEEQLGKTIDVCPNAPFLATNSFSGELLFFSQSFSKDKTPTFIKQSIGGIILQSSFLFPKRSSLSCVTYACLFLESSGTPRILIYRWIHGISSSNGKSYTSHSIPVPLEFAVASHMLACPDLPDHFLLLLENKLCLLSASQIECGDLKFLQENLPIYQSPSFPLSLVIDPTVPNTCFLVYENGALVHVRFSVISMDFFYIGRLNNPLGNYLLPFYPYLLCCGDGYDTSVYDISSSNVTLVSTTPSWSPMWDFVYTNDNQNLLLDDEILDSTCYAISGIAESGALVKLRHGCSISILLEALMTEGALLKGVLESLDDSLFYVWLNYPWQTLVLKLQMDGTVEDISESLALEELLSLDIALINETFMIITNQLVYTVTSDFSRNILMQCPEIEDFILSMHTKDMLYVVSKNKETSESLLYAFYIKFDEARNLILQGLSDPIKISSVPHCITSFTLSGFSVLALGYTSFDFLTYIVFLDESQFSIYNAPLSVNSLKVFPHAISFVKKSEEKVHILLSSYESLVSIPVVLNAERRLEFGFSFIKKLGTLPLSFQNPPNNSEFLYGWDDKVYSISVDDYSNELIVNALNDVENIFHSISGIYDLPEKLQRKNTKMVVYFSKSTLYLSELILPQRTFATKYKIGATPRRVLHDKFTDLLIIGCTQVYIDDIKTSDLLFFDLKSSKLLQRSWPSVDIKGKRVFKNHETLYAMCFWIIKDPKRRKFRYLCLGTGITTSVLNSGRLLILTMTNNDTNSVELRNVITLNMSQPVYSICSLEERGLCYSSGRRLGIKILDLESKKFSNGDCEVTTRSPIVSMHTHKNYIFASSLRDSVSVFEFTKETNTLHLVCNDISPSLGIDCYYLPQEKLLYGCDKEKHISCFKFEAGLRTSLHLQKLEPILSQKSKRKVPLITNRLKYGILRKNDNQDQWGIVVGTIGGDIYKIYK